MHDSSLSRVPFSHALGSHVRLLALIPLYFLARSPTWPALPLVFFLIPLDELIRRGLRTVLHLE